MQMGSFVTKTGLNIPPLDKSLAKEVVTDKSLDKPPAKDKVVGKSPGHPSKDGAIGKSLVVAVLCLIGGLGSE